MSIDPSNPVTRIRPTGGWRAIDLGELWRYRELLYFLAWRDIKLRYKQTALGVAWAVLQPLATMLVFSLFFGKLGNMKFDGPYYPLFVMAALLPWQLFAYSLTQASNSLVSEQRLITKVYFPRLIVPFSSVLAGLADFLVTFVLLLGMMAYYGQVPTWAILALPAFVAFAVVAALSVGLWLSALTVRYRDFRYTLPFLTQFWLFATPVAYSSSIIPPAYRPLYGLNPMAGVVDGFRWCLLGTEPPGGLMVVSVLVVAAMFVGGLFYFRRLERTFADIV
jgi:lipopolysaccharide transport system permease protein